MMKGPRRDRNRISMLGGHTLAAKIAFYVLGVVTSILIARSLGPTGRGGYYLPVTLATVAYYIGNLGTEQAQYRAWARKSATPEQLVTVGALYGMSLGVLAASVTWIVYLIGQ
jgi:O-antigen/teichoic acid export membrane protein